ncbi:MAG: GreA/GreB family elongation factor, partial [Candidatus Paceibacterota bacterium]
SPTNSQFVSLGSQIKVRNGAGERDFLIVGPSEANPAERKISDESPLGQAFMHHSVGEKIEVETPAGIQKYVILEIK